MRDTNGYQSIEIEEQSTNVPLPPYSTTWGNDYVDERHGRDAIYDGQVAQQLAYDSAKLRVRNACQASWAFLRDPIWTFLKTWVFTTKQASAFALLWVFGIIPFIIIGQTALDSQTNYGTPYSGLFETKVRTCGTSRFGEIQNKTVGGVDGFFFLDQTAGPLRFSQAKTIDVMWDVCIGRGAQLLAWWASYHVFSDALLRVIERHPTSYRTFTHICLEGATLMSMWTLFKNLFQTRSKRTWTLFFYMFLATGWVLSMPAFLSAMTGYDSTVSPWVDLEGSNNIVAEADFKPVKHIVWGTTNETFKTATCLASDQIESYRDEFGDRQQFCDCQFPNGTTMPYRETGNYFDEYGYLFGDTDSECRFDFPGNTQTYKSRLYDSIGEERNCNVSNRVRIFDKDYYIRELQFDSGFCYEDRTIIPAKDNETAKLRCLPDTSNPTYEWGFSSMLSALFLIIHFVWALTMYIVWQDAQIGSKLVRSGYGMSQIRATFALTNAAWEKTGLRNKELVRAEARGLKRELFGAKNVRGAEVHIGIFVDGKYGVELDSKEEQDIGVRRRKLREEDRGDQ